MKPATGIAYRFTLKRETVRELHEHNHFVILNIVNLDTFTLCFQINPL